MIRQKIEHAGYTLLKKHGGEVLLREDDTGNVELWFEHDDNPGYTIEIDGVGYEFACSMPLEAANKWP